MALRIPSVLAMLAQCISFTELRSAFTTGRARRWRRRIRLSLHRLVDASRSMHGPTRWRYCAWTTRIAPLRWLESNRPMDAGLYVIAGAMVVYAHCVLSLGLAAGVVYAVFAARKQPRRLVWMGLMVAAIALLSLPLMSQLRTFYATRSIHTVAGAPSVEDLLTSLIPASLPGVLVLFVWLGLMGTGAISRPRCSVPAAVLIGTWALFSPVVLFLLAAGTDVRLFVDRYYSSALPGQALLLAGLLSSIQRISLRKALIIAVAATAILTQGKSAVGNHGKEDWRAAAAFIDKEAGPAPVLLVSSFAEATDFQSVRDPKLREILFAPEVLYGAPARSIRLPHVFTSRDVADLENVAEQLRNERRFYLLTAA